MKALVIGGDAKLGVALRNILMIEDHGKHSVLYTTRRKIGRYSIDAGAIGLDMLHPNWSALGDAISRVTNIYIIAAVTKVVDCESDPNTWRVNADFPVALAIGSRYSGKERASDPPHVTFMSSDAVERAPNLVYSRQKAYAETVVLQNSGCVIRSARITDDNITDLCDALIQFGEERFSGLVRFRY